MSLFCCLKCEASHFKSERGLRKHDQYCKDVQVPLVGTPPSPNFNNEFHFDENEYHFNDIPNDDFETPNEDLKYIRLQECAYEACFSYECFEATDLPSFMDCIPKNSEEDFVCIKLLKFQRLAKLSRLSCNSLLELIKCFNPRMTIPSDWGSMERYMKKKTSHLNDNIISEEVPWPVGWKMDEWSECVACPSVRINSTRDLYEMLAYKLTDPVIMFIWKDHIRLEAERITLADGTTECITDLMTSPYMRHSQEEVRGRHGCDEKTLVMSCTVYGDGVVMGLRGKVKATAVMATFGIFSDALQMKDISKVLLGYINDLSDTSKALIVRHLCTHTDHSKSSAEKEIAAFGRRIERNYWALLFKILIEYKTRGVMMHVLGLGVRRVVLNLNFMVGDDPAIHRYCSMYEGNALRSCVRCLYCLKRDGPFNPDLVLLRNYDDILNSQTDAEVSTLNKSLGIRMTHPQLEVCSQLHSMSLHPLRPPSAHVPSGMVAPGVQNNLHSTPPDILHTWCCGIMKNVLLWVINIVHNVSKLKIQKFAQNKGLLDARVASLKHLLKLQNVTTTYYRNGLTHISKNKSSKQKQATGGGAAGFRSAEFVQALLFIHLAVSTTDSSQHFKTTFTSNLLLSWSVNNNIFLLKVGFEGDIVPITAKTVVNDHITVDNITLVVQTTVAAVLDCYFEILASPMTDVRRASVKDKLSKMSLHFTSLWHLNQRTSGIAEVTLPKSRKRHVAECQIMPFLLVFGPLTKADTATYESYHRLGTTGVYEKTSKRYASQNEEMFRQSIFTNHASIEDFLEAVASNKMPEYVKLRGPYVAPEEIIVKPLNNIRHYDLQLVNGLFEAIPAIGLRSDPDLLPKLLKSTGVNIKKLTADIKTSFQDEGEIWNEIERDISHVKLIQGISIEANEDSRAGIHTMYATESFPSTEGGARYDYVLVCNEDANGVEYSQPAMIQAILEFSTVGNHNDTDYYAYVTFLQECLTDKEQPHRYHTPLVKYQWEMDRSTRSPKRSCQLIELKMIISPAWITPVFSLKHTTILGKRNDSMDRFWYLDRKYCDRAGWEDTFVHPYAIQQVQNEYIPNIVVIAPVDVDEEEEDIDDEDADEDIDNDYIDFIEE